MSFFWSLLKRFTNLSNPIPRAAWVIALPGVLLGACQEATCEQLCSETFFRQASVSAVIAALEKEKVDFVDGHLRTPLHIASATTQNPEVLDLLLKRGAKVNARTKNNGTPLHWAAWFTQNPEIIKTLLKNGANHNAKASNDLTPLHIIAEKNSHPEVLQALLDVKPDINAKTTQGLTPLHLAAQDNPNHHITSILIAKEARLIPRDAQDNTPLHLAAQNNPNFLVTALLLDKKAVQEQVDAQNKNGNTALHLAAQSSIEPRVLTALLRARANPRLHNKQGQTPWDLIQENDALKNSDPYRKLQKANHKDGNKSAGTRKISPTVRPK